MDIELEIDVEKIVADTEEELGVKMPTWHNRMGAVASGVFDYEDATHLCLRCAAIADEALDAERPRLEAEAKAKGKRDMTPSWRGCVNSYLWTISTVGYSDGGEAAGELLREMGEVADYCLAEKATK